MRGRGGISFKLTEVQHLLPMKETLLMGENFEEEILQLNISFLWKKKKAPSSTSCPTTPFCGSVNFG